MKTFLLRHWFLVGLLAVLVMGMVWPERFIYLADSNWFRHGVVATVLFLMSLPLETNALSQTLRRPLPSLLGSFVNMGLMPLMAWGLSRFLTAELSNGLIVASVVPCTLASAAVWTRRAGGNDAAAILVTVLTNATCFLTTPAWLAITTRKRANLDVDALIWQLVLLVLLPLTAGQLVRISPKIAKWSTAHKHQCSVVSLVGILIMVLVGATQCGTKLKSTAWKDALSWIDIGHLILIVIVLHLMALGTGYLLARVARMSRANQIAVAISGSQKTLMVGIHIAVEHFGGLAILPMVTYHVTQLVIDTLIADRLKRTE